MPPSPATPNPGSDAPHPHETSPAESIDFRESAAGVEIPVLASPGSRRNEFRGIHNRHLKISVTAVAEKGKANQAIIRFLARQLEIPKSRFELVSGTTASSKRILIRQATTVQIERRLAELDGTR